MAGRFNKDHFVTTNAQVSLHFSFGPLGSGARGLNILTPILGVKMLGLRTPKFQSRPLREYFIQSRTGLTPPLLSLVCCSVSMYVVLTVMAAKPSPVTTNSSGPAPRLARWTPTLPSPGGSPCAPHRTPRLVTVSTRLSTSQRVRSWVAMVVES